MGRIFCKVVEKFNSKIGRTFVFLALEESGRGVSGKSGGGRRQGESPGRQVYTITVCVETMSS